MIPEPALLLAGFVLAHAAWSISGGPELLVPLAIVQRNGHREVHRFEAETQEEAVSHGKTQMSTLGTDVDAWALAREGLFNEKDGKTDVISVDIGGKGITQHVTFVQRFEPYSAPRGRQLSDRASIHGLRQENRYCSL